jgi:vanillate O-demethylase ferredoxin subunit
MSASVGTATGTAIAVRVARKTVEAEGVAGFRLVAADGARLPAFAPGAHIDVALPGGLVRQYSLCNLPSVQDDHYEIGVLRDTRSRGGSLAMHDAVHEGAVLNISPPRNHFPLDEGATHSLLLAGGIGVTPLLSMAQRLAALGADFALHCCSRTAARAPYRRRLQDSAFAARVFFHHDDGPPAQRHGPGGDASASPTLGKHLYVCGPQGFLDAVRATARELQWAEAQVHFEYFAGAAIPAAEPGDFEVELRSSGRVVRVPASLSVVDALAAEGVAIPVSCAQGVCGTCLTRVLHGDIDHRDLYLTPAEQAANDQFLPCCSRARSARLVLDL